jgi:hypothetical protein
MKLISCQQIRDALKFKLKLVKENRIWLFDKHYCALSKEEFDELRKTVEPITAEYKAELFDCEDFAHVMSAFIKLTALAVHNVYVKGIAFGEITIRHTVSKEIHTLNFLVTEDKEAFYFEPQSQIFVNGKNYEPIYARI